MKRLKIAVYADSYDGKVGQGTNYMHFMSQFGELILVTSDNDMGDVLRDCEILFLPGGADVDPARYGERPSFKCGRPNANYEYMDKHLLAPWLKTGKPIIGICRGIQTLNVAAGGTLWQHMEHHIGGEDRSYLGHKMFTDIKDWEIVHVNSYHHQGIRKLAPGFKDIGWASLGKNSSVSGGPLYFKRRNVKIDGEDVPKKSKQESPMVIECIQHENKPWVAFQYHPEDFNCPFATMMIEKTLKRHKPEFKAKPNDYPLLGWGGGDWAEKKYLQA